MKSGKIEEALEQFIQPIIEKCISKALEENKELAIKDPEQWLTMGKASKEFGCTINTLQQAAAKLELPYYKPENRTYVQRKDVFRYLESIKIKSRDDAEEYQFLQPKKYL